MSDATVLNAAPRTWLDEPRAYEGVRSRRILAFLVDYTIVLLLCIPFGLLVGVLGILTFGLGWMLYGALFPLVAIITGSNTTGRSSGSSTSATACTVAADPIIPIFTASAPRSSSTDRICRTTMSAGTGCTSCTPTVFCAVIAVIAVIA